MILVTLYSKDAFSIVICILCFILGATLRALADITNEHRRNYDIADGQFVTGTIPLVANPVRVQASMESQRAEYLGNGMADASISLIPDSTNFGAYYYNITREFNLLPKSIKTFPFLSTIVSFSYGLETTTYLPSGVNSGLFQRTYIIKPSEFLPAGSITFYLATTSIALGQSRLADTPKETEQKISLGNDPDVRFTIIGIITASRPTPTYSQDLNVNVTISNRKNKQIADVTLTINSGYRNTTLITGNQTSSSIKINQDPNNKSVIIIRASVSPNQNETCTFIVKQSN